MSGVWQDDVDTKFAVSSCLYITDPLSGETEPYAIKGYRYCDPGPHRKDGRATNPRRVRRCDGRGSPGGVPVGASTVVAEKISR